MTTIVPAGILREFEVSASDPRWHGTDRVLASACEAYCCGDKDVRETLRAKFGGSLSCLHFAHRMAVRSMRSTSADDLHKGLVAVAMEDARFDPRESIMSLAMLYHAAQKTSIDFRSLVNQLAPLCSSQMAKWLDDFLRRSPESLSLSEFALVEKSDENGITFGFTL
jgi:hypothetical protein